jgi:hypothetical protein
MREFKTSEDFLERVWEVLSEEADRPRLTWWLSFADGERPAGQQFLGVILVDQCPGLGTALSWISIAGVNPGGEVRGIAIDPNDVPVEHREAFAKLPRLTLLSRADIEAVGIV